MFSRRMLLLSRRCMQLSSHRDFSTNTAIKENEAALAADAMMSSSDSSLSDILSSASVVELPQFLNRIPHIIS